MFGLESGLFITLVLSIFAACAFEFVNGFHDTANAVATVIYTRSLKPNVAVIWSGFWNFLGVVLGGTAVALGIMNLLPADLILDHNVSHGMAMIMAMLVSAILWNLGTWWVGLPASSSHTLIGSILGVGLGYAFVSAQSAKDTINWHKASEIGLSLLFSPLIGFSLAALLLLLLAALLKKSSPTLFSEPPKDKEPNIIIRGLLIITCTLVSFFHGSNDGQKGVGLVMLILIVLVPGHFALNPELNYKDLQSPLATVRKIGDFHDKYGKFSLAKIGHQANLADSIITVLPAVIEAGDEVKRAHLAADLRSALVRCTGAISKLTDKEVSKTELEELKSASTSIKKHIDFAPRWVIIMISVCLGIGTMVGWKRIVVTIGEKIGKEHLTYAQGAVAELIASGTIGISSAIGLPVSTTHVLSSGIAGTMVATNGAKNLQPKTVRNIALAWVLTLPVTISMSAGLFILFWYLL